MYDSTANSWSEKADYPGPYGGAYGASVFTPGSNIMVGGTTGNNYYVYNPATDSWEQKTAASSFPDRTAPGTAQVGVTGYVFGGQDTATGDLLLDVWAADVSESVIDWKPGPPEMPPLMADVVLVPEKYSPTVSLSWEYDLLVTSEQEPEPAVLLYGRSWAYEPGNPNPVLGDATTWLFWPNGTPAGALAGIAVWPGDAVVNTGQQRLFNAFGRDAYGYYVPITPTWEATGGSISTVGRYTAGDLPGSYTVQAAHETIVGQAQVTISGTVNCPDLPPGLSWSHTFAVPGAYPYHDRTSPHHTGTVVVNPTGAGQIVNPSTEFALSEAKGLKPGLSYTTHDVSITATGFDPPTVTISLSDTVRWTNNDTVAHAVDGGEYRRYTVYLPLILR